MRWILTSKRERQQMKAPIISIFLFSAGAVFVLILLTTSGCATATATATATAKATSSAAAVSVSDQSVNNLYMSPEGCRTKYGYPTGFPDVVDCHTGELHNE